MTDAISVSDRVQRLVGWLDGCKDALPLDPSKAQALHEELTQGDLRNHGDALPGLIPGVTVLLTVLGEDSLLCKEVLKKSSLREAAWGLCQRLEAHEASEALAASITAKFSLTDQEKHGIKVNKYVRDLNAHPPSFDRNLRILAALPDTYRDAVLTSVLDEADWRCELYPDSAVALLAVHAFCQERNIELPRPSISAAASMRATINALIRSKTYRPEQATAIRMVDNLCDQVLGGDSSPLTARVAAVVVASGMSESQLLHTDNMLVRARAFEFLHALDPSQAQQISGALTPRLAAMLGSPKYLNDDIPMLLDIAKRVPPLRETAEIKAAIATRERMPG